ncbi:dehydrogenase/reductase sdr family member 11 [Plakobranchus ocellatus]|uniref:Dehydrogenase/reductase sdr family member 11 n=1 Tax=Plakobranchus ocellatus TaxID=259542 RepID=A0AAV4A2U0_9GAST|nr:dehydrogenase/reductase sdr family member 11 [Plakobranchus ocellatus]
MEAWIGRNVLVTGASRGIGKAICEELVRHGLTVIGVAREVHEIEQASLVMKSEGWSGTLVAIKCDISDAKAVKQMFVNIKADPDLEGVDVLISNAAVAMAEPILTGEPAMWKIMMETNVLGPAVLTQEVVTSMAERAVDNGHIIYINRSMNISMTLLGQEQCETCSKSELHKQNFTCEEVGDIFEINLNKRRNTVRRDKNTNKTLPWMIN